MGGICLSIDVLKRGVSLEKGEFRDVTFDPVFMVLRFDFAVSRTDQGWCLE